MAEKWEQVPRHAAQPHLVRDTGGQSSQVPGRHAGDVHTGQPEEPDNDSMGRRNIDLLFTIYIEAIVPAEYSALPCPMPMPDSAQVSLAGEGGGAGQLGEGGGVRVVGVAPRPRDLGCPTLHQGGGQVAGLH